MKAHNKNLQNKNLVCQKWVVILITDIIIFSNVKKYTTIFSQLRKQLETYFFKCLVFYEKSKNHTSMALYTLFMSQMVKNVSRFLHTLDQYNFRYLYFIQLKILE